MTYTILTEDRKIVVKRMEQLTGEKPVYTRMPRCAYVLRGLAVEKDNTLTADETADVELLRKLVEDGLIAGDDAAQAEPASQIEDEFTEESTEEAVEETESQAEEQPAKDVADQDVESAGDADPYENLVVRTEPEETAVKPNISFPLASHRAESICNLVFTIYSRGKLLSKSTGGEFSASEELVELLQSGNGLLRIEEVISKIQEAGPEALIGLSFGDGKVVFDGFPATDEAETVKAWTLLAAAINRSAIKQFHVRAKEVDDANEKFAFRTWLTRLGMNGPDVKKERNILYRNLSGHTAFRTPADEEKWKTRQAAKRAELKAQKSLAEEGQYGAED